jgi:hypothetical protein
MAHTSEQKGMAMAGRYTLLWYGNSSSPLATIDVARGFGKFWFEMQEGTTIRKYDQDGKGFTLPTDSIMISHTSCSLFGANPRVQVAVRYSHVRP